MLTFSWRSCLCLVLVPALATGCGTRPAVTGPTAHVTWMVMLDEPYAREHIAFVEHHGELLRKLENVEHPGRREGEAVAVGVGIVLLVAIVVLAVACGGGKGGGGGGGHIAIGDGGGGYPISLIAIPVGGTAAILKTSLRLGENRFESPLPADCDVDISTEIGGERWYVGRVHAHAHQELAVAVTLAGPHLQATAGGTFAAK